MAREGTKKFWFLFILATWVLPTIVAWTVTLTLQLRFFLLVWQQSLFIFAGLWGSDLEKHSLLGFAAILRGLVYGFGLLLFNALIGTLNLQIVSCFVGLEAARKLILQERAGVDAFLQSGNPLLVTGVVILLIIAAPLGEELFFRGFLLAKWKKSLGTRKAVVLTALLFAVLHFYLVQFIPVLVAGVVLGLMFVRTENIAIPIIAHAFVNTMVLLLHLAGL